MKNIHPNHLTRAEINLDHLTWNMALLQELAGARPMWPAIKANAYGHGMEIIARHLVKLGYNTLCVAHITEAIALVESGVDAKFVLLSATLPEHSEAIVTTGCEPVVCTFEMIVALARDAEKLGRQVSVHLMVDTGMGRIGIHADEVIPFLEQCRKYPSINVRGVMSHFPCADETNKALSLEQIEQFQQIREMAREFGITVFHMANSAAIFDLPGSYFDAVRPGIAIYGLPPSNEIINLRVQELKPVLAWKTQITFLKEVPAHTGLSYGHAFHTQHHSLVATVPVGYGDGLHINLSNRMGMLVHGKRCSQIGRITMDQSLLDVSHLRGKVKQGDEVVIIGQQGQERLTADELAITLGTINYEVVTTVAQRVHRVAVGGK
ncbi:MAG: alanine racemase [Burkholderiales bacterium]|nr:alanine racemase [Nitrosomonas sp.]MCP5274654.1 alanine racemase [Burkholderiales bacterium]